MIDNKIIVFENEDFGELRTVEIDGEVWFVGKDVAMIDVIDSDTVLRDIFEEIVDRYIQIKSGMEVINNA